LDGIPVSRVENMCATGTEALRGAAYAVASGAVDIALAVGAEKLKDTGYGGLPVQTKGTFNDLWLPMARHPPVSRSLRPAIGRATRFPRGISSGRSGMSPGKSHQNGVLRQGAPSQGCFDGYDLKAPMIAEPLGLFDCCGVSDGAAAAIVTTPEIAARS